MSPPVPRALLFVDLVESTALVEQIGDARAADVFARFDQLARASFARHGGREIDRTDGFLVLFERPAPAVLTAFDLHDAARSLSLSARAAVHFGDVVLRENPPDDVLRGAKPLEVDGLAKPVAARLLSLALPGQTLLTPIATELAKRAQVGGELGAETRFLDHGAYRLKGLSEPLHIHEAGLPGRAPLRAPPRADKAAPVRHRGPVLGILALVVVLATASAYLLRPAEPPPIPTFRERRVLSEPVEREIVPMLRPDGGALVFTQRGEIRMMALPNGEPQTVHVDVGGPAAAVEFIPPGDDLLVVAVPADSSEVDGHVFRVSADGSVTSLPWTATRVTVSGDGKRVLLEKHDGLWVGDLETGRSTRIGPKGPPGWSPDGEEVVQVMSAGTELQDLVRIATDGSKMTKLLENEQIFDRYELQPFWLEENTLWIPFHRTVGDNRSGGIEQVRLDPRTGGVIFRDPIKEWPDDKVAALDVARGGDVLVVTRATTQDEVFVVDVGPDGLPTGEPKPVTQHRRSDRPTDWLPDGRVVFTSDRSGVFDVYAQRPGEEAAERLAGGPAIQSWGRVTSTGAVLSWDIVPVASPAEVQRARVVRHGAEGPPRTLLEIEIESTLRMSGRPPPSAAWISCARFVETCLLARTEGDRTIVRLMDPATGMLGDPIHRQDAIHDVVELSPDGTRVATAVGDKIQLVRVADQGIEEILLEGVTDLQYLAWRPDGESLYVTGLHRVGPVLHRAIFLVDLRTRRVVPIRSGESWRGQVTVSWDGRQVAWLEWDGSNEVFLYERTN